MFDRKTHWENIYRDKSPEDVSWYQREPSLSLQLIRNTRLAHDEPVIDVGGGSSILADYLIWEGYSNLAVLDISGNALARARNRLGDDAKNVEWYENDITDFEAPLQFSLWHDRAVFHFLTAESDRKRYVKTLQNSLKPGGHLIISAFAIGGPDKCSGLDIVQYDDEKLLAELGENFELIEAQGEIHITPAQKEQKFMYFRLIKKPG